MFDIKKIMLCVLLLPVALCSTEIVEYKPEYKEAIVKIALQDKSKMFVDFRFANKVGCGLAVLGMATGALGRQFSNSIVRNILYIGAAVYGLTGIRMILDNTFDLSKTKKDMIEKSLQDPLKKTYVILDDKSIVSGFIITHKSKEQSIEALRKRCEDAGRPLAVDNAALKKFQPTLKETEEKCQEFLMVEAIGVSRDHRRKGYAQLLMEHAIERSHKILLPYISLNVAWHNKPARAFYEKLGFLVSEEQEPVMSLMGVIQYRKLLS
jgi:GNAT superfamily N-acetyltransferase